MRLRQAAETQGREKEKVDNLLLSQRVKELEQLVRDNAAETDRKIQTLLDVIGNGTSDPVVKTHISTTTCHML